MGICEAWQQRMDLQDVKTANFVDFCELSEDG